MLKKWGLLMVLATLFISVTGFAEVTRLIKIGYVDVEEVFENYPGTEDVKTELVETKEEYQAEILEMKEEIAQLESEFELNFDSLTDDERERREVEIEYKREALYEYIEEVNDELEALTDTLTDPIYLKIAAVIQTVSAEKGFSFVFRESSNALLYLDDEFDITEDVIDRLETELELEDRY